MFYIFIFLFGISIGSFLNVVICRLGTKESILLSRSRCPECGTLLKWFDLIPLLSFIIQKGRCRYCGKKISWQYPIVELVTGLLFLSVILSEAKNPAAFVQNPSLILETTFYLLFVCLLVVVFFYDLRHYLIPDKIIYPAIIISLIYRFFEDSFFNSLSAALLAAGFFLALVLVSKGKWLGMGDVKLAGLMGLVLGWPNVLIALFLAFMSGAMVGIALIMAGKKTLKSQIPFGPFLAGSTIVAMLYSTSFLDLLHLFV